MEFSGSRLVPASPAAVRAGLHDPETLKACIPGCERLERTSDGAYEGTVATKIGPLRATLAGTASATAEDGGGWTIEAQGSDPAAGGGRASGRVTLSEAEGGTLVAYEGQAEVEGKIGQLGSRLVTGVARQAIEAFLTAFAERAAAGAPPSGAGESARDAAPRLADAPPLVHEDAAPDAALTLTAPPIAGVATPLPGEPAPIAPTSVPEVPDPAALAAADAAQGGGGSVGRIMLVAAIAVVVGVAIYLGFLQRPPA